MQTILETKKIKRLREEKATLELLHTGDQSCPGKECPILKTVARELEDAEDRAPQLLQRDHMPAQVATEMLLNSARMSGTMRRNCQRARERHFVSVQTREAGIYKIARRFSRANLQQLGKWLQRAINLKAQTQRELKLVAKLPEPKKTFLTKLLDAREEACVQTIDTIQLELRSRPISYGI